VASMRKRARPIRSVGICSSPSSLCRNPGRVGRPLRKHVDHIVNGEIDGQEIGYHRDGAKAYEIQYAKGKPVDRWVHWYANGKKESEETYVEDKLDGATIRWREDGTLLEDQLPTG
jgi:antitoxin component YwqK of YwqJK toxin-antitoxin module